MRLPLRNYRLYDLDGDGVISPEVDGIGLDGHPFVLRLGARMLTEAGQGAWHSDHGRLIINLESSAIDERTLRDLSLLTELRLRSGLPRVPLLADRSADCLAHIGYLDRNHLISFTTGLRLHEEDPALPGYSAAGAAAGRESCISLNCTSLSEAMGQFWCSAWHAAPLIDPQLRGISGPLAKGVGMVYMVGQGWSQTPVSRPADGEVAVPCTFAPKQEVSSPGGSTGGVGCGFPIIVLMPYPLHKAAMPLCTLENADGKPVPGFASSPAKPASGRPSERVALFLPQRPLWPHSRYVARFRFEGLSEPMEIHFSAGDR